MAIDRDVIGRISHNKIDKLIAQERSICLIMPGIAADDFMLAEQPDIPWPRHRAVW